VTVLEFGRNVICEACGRVFFERFVAAPHCCPKCEEIAEAGMLAEIEAEARSNGFESFDAWAAAGYPTKAANA